MQNPLSLCFRWLALCLAMALAGIVHAQGGATFPKEKLDQLTAPIALYPDALLAQVLMASTYPADVKDAAAWSRANSETKGDEAVTAVQDKPWDPSVQSLVAFPQVIIMMGEKPEWVQELGDAFLAQPEDVMDSVQRLRAQAQKAGNLSSNEQVKVTTEPAAAPATTTTQAPAPAQQTIIIEPATPQVVYVPTYNPTVVYGPWLYPAYPPYYIPYPPGYWFSSAIVAGIGWGIGIGITNALWGGCNWRGGNVNINVNRYNNINVNKRLDVNVRNTNWNHNVQNRRDVPYRGGDATRQKLEQKQQVAQREAYRGRDASRDQARAAMEERGVKTDQAALRDVKPEQVRQATQQGERAARDRAQQASRDNALRNPQDPGARRQVDRGTASRQQMQQRPQTQTRPQPQSRPQPQPQARPQPQRPAGGGVGGGRAGGGGGRGGGGGGRGR